VKVENLRIFFAMQLTGMTDFRIFVQTLIMGIVFPYLSPVGLGWDHHLGALSSCLIDEQISVIGFINEQVVSKLDRNQARRRRNVVYIAAGQADAKRIAQCIN
jgi:hypothetical protein